MTSALEAIDYGFAYVSGEPVLRNVNFRLERGAFAVLCGASGTGKSTLLRAFKPELSLAGEASGSIRVLGEETGALGRVASAAQVGLVMQDPENQIVTDTVWHELAFGLESVGMPTEAMRRRVAETAHFFGIGSWFDRRTDELSGGQKQLLNLAAVVAMQPAALVLDEPTSQLDPLAAKGFLEALARVNAELGVTVLIAEHRLEGVLPLADRVLLLGGGGGLVYDGDRDGFVRLLAQGEEQGGLVRCLPAATRLALMLGHGAGELAAGSAAEGPDQEDPLEAATSLQAAGERMPMTVREGRALLADELARRGAATPTRAAAARAATTSAPIAGDVVLEARDLWFRYGREQPYVLRGVDLAVRAGCVSAIVGGNGSGKSTLLAALAGVRRLERGRVRRARKLRVALMAQNPKTLFVRDRLMDDLMEWSAEAGYGEQDARSMLGRLGLEGLGDRHPFDLSGGELQKAALAKVLLLDPDVLLLDEPVKGIDIPARDQLGRVLTDLAHREGKAVVFTAHDLEFVAEVADLCSMLFGCEVACTEGAHDFFADNLFYSTAASRIARGLIPGCVTLADAAAALGA